MPCVGYLTGYCYVNVCSSYRGANGTWDYNLNGESGGPYSCPSNTKNFPTAAGQTIYDENIEALRNSVNDERARRNGTYGQTYLPTVWTPTPIVGTDEDPLDPATSAILIYGQDAVNDALQQIKVSINQMVPNAITVNFVDGAVVRFADINTVRSTLDALRLQCVCYTDCGGHLVCGCYDDCVCYY